MAAKRDRQQTLVTITCSRGYINYGLTPVSEILRFILNLVSVGVEHAKCSENAIKWRGWMPCCLQLSDNRQLYTFQMDTSQTRNDWVTGEYRIGRRRTTLLTVNVVVLKRTTMSLIGVESE